jgi:hypothetical protein
MVAWTNAPRLALLAMVQPDCAAVMPPAPVSWNGVARPAADSGLAGTMMSQAVFATGAGADVVADADGDGVTQAVEVGLADAVTVEVGAAVEVGVEVGVTVGIAVELTVVVGVTVGVAVEVAVMVGMAESVGMAGSVGMAEAVVVGVVVPGLADDDTQAAPRAASLVVLSFVPELDEKSIPATTPRTATSIPTIAPRRARGRSSNTW